MDNEEHLGPFNIGNPGEFTMLQLAEVVRELINPGVEIAFVENTADDPSRRRPDISLAKSMLGWEPRVPLREGLLSMIEDFRARLGMPPESVKSRLRAVGELGDGGGGAEGMEVGGGANGA
jgi:UDP-glucuronate decarboxylase